jgi:hypothetical protein
VLKVELPLRDRLWRHNMPCDMTLQDIRNTQLDVVGVLANQWIWLTV